MSSVKATVAWDLLGGLSKQVLVRALECWRIHDNGVDRCRFCYLGKQTLVAYGKIPGSRCVSKNRNVFQRIEKLHLTFEKLKAGRTFNKKRAIL
jgi:hypothetical protein